MGGGRLQNMSTEPDRLTASEYRIMWLHARGLDRKQIARALGRSPQTISNSLTLAKEKLGARSLAEAVWLLIGSSEGRNGPPHEPLMGSPPEDLKELPASAR